MAAREGRELGVVEVADDLARDEDGVGLVVRKVVGNTWDERSSEDQDWCC